MRLIIASILFGILGFIIGAFFQNEGFIWILAFIGFFSPGLYTLDKVYEDLNKKQNGNSSFTQ